MIADVIRAQSNRLSRNTKPQRFENSQDGFFISVFYCEYFAYVHTELMYTLFYHYARHLLLHMYVAESHEPLEYASSSLLRNMLSPSYSWFVLNQNGSIT